MIPDAITHDRLRAEIAAILEIAPTDIGDEDNLMDLGLDSMRTMNLIMQWEEAGVPIGFPDLAEDMTLGGIWRIVSQRL